MIRPLPTKPDGMPILSGDVLHVLRLDASARREGSVSRILTGELVDRLRSRPRGIVLVERNLAGDMAHVDGAWLEAMNMPEAKRSHAQLRALDHSKALIDELRAADVLVIGIPIYNFTIPSTLKAWVDHVCRSKITFAYTEKGPKGLLKNKSAVLAFATGGTEIGGELDFASDYMRHILGFIGITDVHIVAADALFADREAAMKKAREQIEAAEIAVTAG